MNCYRSALVRKILNDLKASQIAGSRSLKKQNSALKWVVFICLNHKQWDIGQVIR